MSTQTDHWRKYAIKLIAQLRLVGYTYKQIAEVLNIKEDAIRMIHTRWGKKYLG